MKFTISIGVITLIILFGGVFLLTNNQNPAPTGDVIATNGLHWHPKLTIYIKGEKQQIPANVGIGQVHLPIHTHEDVKEDIIHMEFSGLVTKKAAKLNNFFQNWKQPFSATTLLNKQAGPEDQIKMFVNGQPNFEFENYIMKDRDNIEIRFE